MDFSHLRAQFFGCNVSVLSIRLIQTIFFVFSLSSPAFVFVVREKAFRDPFAMRAIVLLDPQL